ncbi:uncharacterized protein LOC114740490 isoform X2 [Neltuma alba]|nr:uncharacterized protein LOC114740490 isoform X2 [Prosopis alba]XP_028784480.1 uncharacterized protein LOC114740490 isoform X2 [Prosopis alba]XP_028784481.1 uncharacterized protein LOC114740490 isoform X2 [Prosopis alba]
MSEPQSPRQDAEPQSPRQDAEPQSPRQDAEMESLHRWTREMYRQLFRLPLEEVLLGHFACSVLRQSCPVIGETKWLEGRMCLYKNFLCFYTSLIRSERVIPYDKVTSAKKVQALAIDIVVGSKEYCFNNVHRRDEAFALINTQCSKHLCEQGETVDKKTKSADDTAPSTSVSRPSKKRKRDKPDNCTLFFSVIATRSMIKREELVIKKKLYRRMIYRRLDVKPLFFIESVDNSGRPKQWTIVSEQNSFEGIRKARFKQGWEAFMVQNAIKEGDIITFKKRYKRKRLFAVHVDRWDKTSHQYVRSICCLHCNHFIRAWN